LPGEIPEGTTFARAKTVDRYDAEIAMPMHCVLIVPEYSRRFRLNVAQLDKDSRGRIQLWWQANRLRPETYAELGTFQRE
jgi:hypothetical protein